MEKRKNKRVKKRMLVKVNNQTAILIDISRSGFKLSSTALPKSRQVEVELKADGQIFNLKGRTCWISRKVTTRKVFEIGIDIEESPPAYQQFLNTVLPAAVGI